MKEKSISERVRMLMGRILGIVVWLGGIVFAFRTIRKMIENEQARQAVNDVEQQAGSVAQSDPGRSTLVSEPGPIEPDVTSGEGIVVQEFGSRTEDLAELQHADLGGVPERPISDTAPVDSESGSSGASAYSSSGIAYDADLSAEGVELTPTDETDRSNDTPLDEGIPNLGEPGDIEDSGPGSLAAEAGIDEVPGGVAEESGETEDIDSSRNDGPWVVHASGDEDEIPAASRGFREYGETDGEESESEEASDTGNIGLYEDIDASGAGGEVDLENDESPAWDESEMSIVDDPDESLAADAANPLDDEETLGLRDSESPGVDNDLELGDESSRSTSTGEGDQEDQAGYSAAWSTTAGLVGHVPDRQEGSSGFERLEELGTTDASRESGTGTSSNSEAAGGDPADLTSSAVGDLGATTSPGALDQGSLLEDAGAGNEATSSQESEPSPRKSRKQRRTQSDWVPSGAVKGDGSLVCPTEFPIKGNANSRIYHRPTDPSYAPTIPEYCFATEEDAQKAGFRAPRG